MSAGMLAKPTKRDRDWTEQSCQDYSRKEENLDFTLTHVP
jgi:hypothetical protein